MNAKQVINLYDRYVLNTYTRTPFVIAKAKGAVVWDINGKGYLDFFPGWAVSGIGHCHPMVVSAVKKQVAQLIHVSNNFYSQKQAGLAKVISQLSLGGGVFFANSGAEANEAAVKLARAYGHETGRYKIITMEKSFHGRTLAMIAATGQDKVKKGFDPLPEGFVHVPFNNIDAVKKAIDAETIAVMLEPIQGEGGINIAGKDYINHLRALCDAKDMLLIFDEVQTGIGRTGRMFAYQHYDAEPDLMTLAKSLGGGLPIGAMVTNKKFSEVLKPGMHASTFGGSPVICAAALAVFGAIKKERLITNANRMGEALGQGLKMLMNKHSSLIKNIRQMALMIGVELSIDGAQIAQRCFEKGLLINCTQGNILRIMPPLVVTRPQINKALEILDAALKG